MSTFVSREVQAGIEAAHKQNLRKKSRLRVHFGEEIHTILKFSENTFVLDAETASDLRGLVDIFDGGRHLYQALIVASSLEGDELSFEFKRNTMASDRPARDFYAEPDAPAGLLELQ